MRRRRRRNPPSAWIMNSVSIIIRHAAACLVLAALAVTAAARPGDLDIRFGRDGRVLGVPPNFTWTATGLTVQSDGKIVAAGAFENAFQLARFGSDGAL